MRLWYRICRSFFQVLYCALFNVRVFGKENIPLTGPFLLVSNHQSFLDPVLCGITAPRELDYMARDSLFKNPLFGFLIRSVNAFPLQRDQTDVSAVRHIIHRLRNNRGIVLFPEATRSGDGRILPIKRGFDLIARRGKATIIPTLIDGAFEAWPRQQFLPSLAQIRVIYGKPIFYETVQKLTRQNLVHHINHQLRTMQYNTRKQYGKRCYKYDDELLIQDTST